MEADIHGGPDVCLVHECCRLQAVISTLAAQRAAGQPAESLITNRHQFIKGDLSLSPHLTRSWVIVCGDGIAALPPLYILELSISCRQSISRRPSCPHFVSPGRLFVCRQQPCVWRKRVS